MTRLSRLLWMPFVAAALLAQQPPAPEQEPPEEDRPIERTPEYTLNPLQADKELQVGKFYWKRESYRAAAGRFDEATKWNPGLSEAWLRLGDARLKLEDAKGARAAYEKYLELEPEGGEAGRVRKFLKGPKPRK